MKKYNDKTIIKIIKQNKLYIQYRILVNALVRQMDKYGNVPNNSITRDFKKSFINNDINLLIKTLQFIKHNTINSNIIYDIYTYQW